MFMINTCYTAEGGRYNSTLLMDGVILWQKIFMKVENKNSEGTTYTDGISLKY